MRHLLALAVVLSLAACAKKEAPPAAELPPEPTQPTAESATPPPAVHRVVLKPTQNNQAAGELTLASEAGAVVITGQLTGLKPDTEHGFHIHEKGDCSAPDASSAGGHFNPGAQEHGNPEGGVHHAGDMLNAKSDAQGNATVTAKANGVTLGDAGPNDVVGKSVVLHEKADDYKTQPSGDSGARIACGVIE